MFLRRAGIPRMWGVALPLRPANLIRMGIFRKSAVFSVLALWVCLRTEAQENRFLYIQTEDGQPFYLKTAAAHHSSTISGFLILPRLQDTALDFVIGFPRDMYPAHGFRLSTSGRDRGMVLKRQEDGRWALVDLHTMEVSPGREVVKDAPLPARPLQPATSDSFTTMLSTAIGDSSLLETRVVAGQAAAVPVAKAPPAAAATDTSKAPSAASLPPVPPPSAVQAATDSASMIAKAPERPSAVAPPVVEEVRDSSAASVPPVQEAAPKGSAGPEGRSDRTDCRSTQSVKQLGDLRRRMESLRDEEAKVAEALREMRIRCFTTEQVRSLLVVFDREEGRYKLLSTAYPLVQDPSNYPSLLPVLKDPYFIHRFKRLTGIPVE